MVPLPSFQKTADGYLIPLKVTPKASRNKVGDFFEDAKGQQALRIYVTSPPDKGKANKEVIELLSKYFKVPKSTLEIISGETSRNKIVKVPLSAHLPEKF